MQKIILVTGGNRGIGLEICRQLSAGRHIVLMGSREMEKGEEATEQLPGSIHPRQLDVTNESDITNLANTIEKEFGKLDVLINNAGITSSGTPATHADLGEVQQVMHTNFLGPWKVIQHMLPFLQKGGAGRIINMSSGMGALDDLNGGYAAYRMSKTALNGLTIQLANELKGSVSVNAMCPGWVRTDMGGPHANRSVEEGADTASWLATAEEVPTGKFFRDRKMIPW